MAVDVSVRGLWKSFASDRGEAVVALRGVDLDIEEGKFYVLVGDSGSGKTTLMRSVAGLEVPDRGKIMLRGAVVSCAEEKVFLPPQGRQIGMVFQSYAIWPHLTVYENLALPLLHGRQRPPRAEVKRKVSEALDVVGLSALADRPAPNLSGGQQQRVALARAIAVSSRLLLMDEPMSNLDARLRHEVRTQIRSVARHYGTTVLYVTHDQEEAMALADHMALMRNGEIMQRGTPEDLYDRSNSREVAEFFGPMNIIAGERDGDRYVRTSIGRVEVSEVLSDGRRLLIGTRPERIQVNPPPGDSANMFDARVLDRVFLGSVKVYQLGVGTEQLRLDTTVDLEVGQTVAIGLPPAAIRVFPDRAGQA